MKVLVTGATGFIGNYVVQELLERDHMVIATSTNKENAQKKKWFNKVNYIPFDLGGFNNSVDYFSFFDQPDCMIHLAWEGLPNYKDSFHIEVNLPRHLQFLNNLISNGLSDLTVAGTCFEYGMQEGSLDEGMPSLPQNSYGIAKNRLRESLEKLSKEKDFNFKWVRLFYMYGEGQNPKSLFTQLDKAISTGEPVFNMSGGMQTRDYLPVSKVAEYIVSIALQKKVDGIINCCSGLPVKILDLVNEYLRSKGADIKLNLGYYPYPDYEPMHFWGSNKKLLKALSVRG
jgi:dTDP-6-deoxy-L-talose 4-dehydrogenase (NAD+)